VRKALCGALLVLAVFGLGCPSDQKRVTNALAARHYHAAHYKAECEDVVGPPTCAAYGQAVNALLAEVTITNETQKIGKLPPSARKNLKTLTSCIEKKGVKPCPTTSQPASPKP
jgi:hypothetical protein